MERPREADQLMAIEQQLTDTLTQAIRAKDTRTANVVRMLKTRLQERRTAKGFSGQVDDAFLLTLSVANPSRLRRRRPRKKNWASGGPPRGPRPGSGSDSGRRFFPR